jgi:hypothetical protein
MDAANTGGAAEEKTPGPDPYAQRPAPTLQMPPHRSPSSGHEHGPNSADPFMGGGNPYGTREQYGGEGEMTPTSATPVYAARSRSQSSHGHGGGNGGMPQPPAIRRPTYEEGVEMEMGYAR